MHLLIYTFAVGLVLGCARANKTGPAGPVFFRQKFIGILLHAGKIN